VIGTDASLLATPARVKNMRLGMAERYEIIIDFSKYPIGTKVVLQNLGLPNNDDYDRTNQIMRSGKKRVLNVLAFYNLCVLC
jgi:spore coat protein A